MSRPIDLDTAIESMTNAIWLYPNELYKGLNQYEAARELAEMGLSHLPPIQSSPCEFCKHNDIADETVCLRCQAERRENE